MNFQTKESRRYWRTNPVLILMFADLFAVSSAWAGTGSAGEDPCVPPDVAVRATLIVSNDTGQTANDFHCYMYQKDKPGVNVNGGSANCGDFGSVGVGLDSDNRGGGGSVPAVPPGVGPPYHGANVNMNGGSVPPDGVIRVDLVLCMTEKNNLKVDWNWTSDGNPIPGNTPAGGFRAGGPAPGGGGGNTSDPGGGGQGAQGGGGGTGNYVHMICIENDSYTNCMLVPELKLLASMTYYADLTSIDWANIDPVKNDKNEPQVTIQPRGKWWYAFQTTGSYLDGHVYMNFDMKAVSCGKSAGPKDAGGGSTIFGDHPIVELSPDADSDGLYDDWEDVFELSTTDNGSVNPDNGPQGDPDHDGFSNLREQTLLSDPNDPTSPLAVTAGYDMLRTVSPVTWNFGAPPLTPIPPGFFGPGSDPFPGSITLVGQPLVTFPGCPGPLGQTDTVIQRAQPAALPGIPSSDTVQIEIVGLSLVSSAPIVVTYGGGSPTTWDVRMSVSPLTPSQGQMAITKTNGNGGTFNSAIQILPLFTFTEHGNPNHVIEQLGVQMGWHDTLTGNGASWQGLAPELNCPTCASAFVEGYKNGTKTPFTLQGSAISQTLEPSCPYETTPPTGTILINNNRSATNTPNVTLALTWDDGGGSGVVRMRFSDDGSHWTAWETLLATRAYTLPGADGYKTVRVQYLDKMNNRSAVFNDFIRLDTTPPTGSIIINNGASTTTSQSVTLGLAWTDGAGAGVTRMRFSDNGSTWTSWTPIAASRAHTLPAGLGYHTVRVQYLDGANNSSPVYNDYIKLVAP